MLGNLNYYYVFITVARTGSISRAADKLFISQPAVSKSIKSLEEQLGTVLFVRNKKGVKLTAEGRLLYEHVESAFSSIENAEDDIAGSASSSGIELRIGVSTSLCRYVLLDYLRDYINDNPSVNITIDCHATLNTIPLVADGTLDLGLICKTDLPSGVSYVNLKEIHDVFVTNKTYLDKLSSERERSSSISNPYLMMGNFTGMIEENSRKNNIMATKSHAPGEHSSNTPDRNTLSTRDILETGNLMLLEKGNITRRHIDNYLFEKGIEPSRILEVNNMDLLIDFAAIGMGVSCVVKEFAEDKLRDGSLVTLPLSSPLQPRKIGFIYKRKRREITSFLEEYVNLI